MSSEGTALITGASRGIGLALVSAMQEVGWRVIATCRQPAQAPELVRTGARILQLDVTDQASCDAAAAAVSSLDVLINNAAVFPEEGSETLSELDLAHFTAAFETNVVGVARVTRAFLPALGRGRNPRIVNISSGAGSISDKDDYGYYAYSTSKAALNMLTRAMSAEFRSRGISTIALSPGWVRTEMGGPNGELSPEESAAAIARTIGKLTLASTGQFMGRSGSSEGYDW